MNRVVILGNHTQGLGIVRSLHGYPAEVHMVNDKFIALARFSRYLDRYHRLPRHTFSRLPSPAASDLLVQRLNQIASETDRSVIFCTDEDLVRFVDSNRDRLDDAYRIPGNDIELITDKYRFARFLVSLGLSSPETFLLSKFDPHRVDSDDMEYLLKGRRGSLFKQRMKHKAIPVSSSAHIKSLTASSRVPEDQVIVQEKLLHSEKVYSGCGFSVEGRILEEFQYVKIRQRPRQFGTGTFLKSLHDENLSEIAANIVKGLEYTGIFEIEATRDGEGYRIIEMNPRTWKSISFSTVCGINLCRFFCEYLLEGTIPEETCKPFELDHSWSHFSQDLVSMISNRDFDRSSAEAHYCVLDVRDPLPFIMELILMPLILLKV